MAADDAASLRWREAFIATYLERYIPALGPRIPATTLRRLSTMLAHQQGALLNQSQLAAALAVSGQTVMRYIDLLCDLMLVRRLPAWHGNVGKRLVRAPKVYVRDSGIVHALLGLADLEQSSPTRWQVPVGKVSSSNNYWPPHRRWKPVSIAPRMVPKPIWSCAFATAKPGWSRSSALPHPRCRKASTWRPPMSAPPGSCWLRQSQPPIRCAMASR